MHVLKFGGTSMGDEHSWRKILDIIEEYDQAVVIVSATARTTRRLIAAAEKILENPEQAMAIAEEIRGRHRTLIENFLAHHPEQAAPKIREDCQRWIDRCISALTQLLNKIAEDHQITPPQKDTVASIGEQLSAYLFARCGRAYGLSTTWVDASRIIKTDSSFGQAIPDRSLIKSRINGLSNKLEEGSIPVMGGFYGANKTGQITTLGFEGSDYTASLVGAALGAEAIEIWTDVSGIYTCDPRVVENAWPISELSFREATELAYFGAKVLHPSTMKPAASSQIPVYVKNIFEPEAPGTKIHGSESQNGPAKALTFLSEIVILTVTADGMQEGHQFLADVFEVLHSQKIPVNAVTTTEASVSVALSKTKQIKALNESLKASGIVDIKEAQGLISLISCNFEYLKEIQQHVFSGLEDIVPSLISYSKSKRNLNIAVDENLLVPAVRRIHYSLFGQG